MKYLISAGILESELSTWLTKAGKKYSTFPDDRVNYTDADIAPVVMITIVCDNEILLAKRGQGLADAEGYWSTINGFIDEDKPVAKIAAQELKEELDLHINPQKIKVGPSYTIKNLQAKRSYIIFPCLVKLDSKPKIILDHEHTKFIWTSREKISSYEMLDDIPYTIDAALKLL